MNHEQSHTNLKKSRCFDFVYQSSFDKKIMNALENINLFSIFANKGHETYYTT